MDDSAGRTPQKHQLRTARACEACRSTKSKCSFKTPEHKTCQRCEQGGSQCIVRVKARPMRARATRPTGPGKPLSPRAGDFSITLPSVSAPNSIKDVRDLHDHHQQFFGDEKTELDGEVPDDGPRLIERRRLTLCEAEELFALFRNKTVLFPFVRIHADDTVPSMARHSPFLLLAILTVAAARDPPLRHQLDQEFRRILSTKVIAGAQKSLDFLQGLLVYIAWYPLHSKPKSSQVFMYTNIAIGLALDLGLEKEVPSSESFHIVNTKGLIENEDFTPAAKRAYLGTYFISAALSMGFQKPNNMQYRNLMDEHGEALLAQEPASDIMSMISIQRLGEKIAVFHRERDLDVVDPMTAEMNAQIFNSELQNIKANTPESVWNLPHILLFAKFIAVTIYSHEIGFLRRPYREHFKKVQANASTAHVQTCLEKSKEFFTYLLSIPEIHYKNFSAFQWSYLVQVTLITSRLTFVLASHLCWSPTQARSNIPLVMYLDALCFRFNTLTATPSTSPGVPPQSPDILYVFRVILESVKRNYEKRVEKIVVTEGHTGGDTDGGSFSFATTPGGNLGVGNGGMGVARGHCPLLDPGLKGMLDSPNGSTYSGSWEFGTPESGMLGLDMSGNGMDFGAGMGIAGVGVGTGMGGMGTGVYHDLWATMTGSWAEEG